MYRDGATVHKEVTSSLFCDVSISLFIMASRILDKIIGREQELLDGARTGKVDVIERLVTKKSRNTLVGSLWKTANVNCEDREGYTPLHLASLHGHSNAVEVLLKADAGGNNTDNKGCTPLHLAAWKGYHEICTLLLSNEHSPVSVNIQDSNGDTALHFASQHGHAEVVSVLVKFHADPAIRNLKEESPLDLAAQYGRLEVVQLLLGKFPDLSQKTILNQSPLHLAAACGHRQILEILLDAGFHINTKTDKGTALHVAVMYCKVDVVRLLVERGIDIGEVDRQRMTALSIARQTEHIQKTSQDIIKIINDHLKKIDDDWKQKQAAMLDKGGKVDYIALDCVSNSSCLTVPAIRSSMLAPGRLVTEDMYAKPQRPERLIDSDSSESGEDIPQDKEAPPIPPRSESFLLEQKDVLSDDLAVQHKKKEPVILPPFNPRRHSSILPHQSSLQEIMPPKPALPRQPSLPNVWPSEPPRAVDLWKENCRNEERKLGKEEEDDYMNVKGISRPESVKGISRPESDDDLPPPPPCVGDEGSHANISKDGTSRVSPKLVVPGTKQTPPAKPERKKRNLSPHSSPNLSQSSNRNQLQVGHMTNQELSNKDKLQYMQMNQVGKDGKSQEVKGYMQMHEVNRRKESLDDDKDDYLPMNEVGKQEVDEEEDYMQLREIGRMEKNVSSVRKDDYTLMQDLDKEIGRKIPGKFVDEDDDDFDNYDLSGSLSKKAVRVIMKKAETLLPVSEPKCSHSSSSSDDDDDDESSPSLPFVNYENSDIIKERLMSAKHSAENVETETSDLDRTDMESSKIFPRIPVSVKDSPDEGDNVNTSSQAKNRKSYYDNMDNEDKVDIPSNPVERTPNVVKGDNSNCDGEKICDKNESVVMYSVKDSVTDEELVQQKRLSNGFEHSEKVTDSSVPPQTRESKVPKPPSLEFQRKRITKEVQPLTPTGYNQCPTPDFPPPSPNTAMQGIQEKIADIDNKRQSRDMETITEAAFLRSPDNPPEGTVQDNNITNTSREEHPSDVHRHSNGSSEDAEEESRVTLRPRIRSGSAGDAVGAVPYRKSTSSSASSSSQEDLAKADELGSLAGLLRGSAPGKPRRIVSQIYDNVRYRQMRAKKGKSLPPGMTSTFDPLMEKEEDLDTKKMIDAISNRNSVTASAESDESNFDDNEEWDQIASTLASFGAGMARESVFMREMLDEFTKHLASTGASKIQSVGEWLEEIGMGRYENTLIANGYNDTDFLGGKIVEDGDLELIGIKDIEHRKKILEATKTLPDVKPIDPDNPPASVEQWLQSINLLEYLSTFIDHKCDTMDRVLKLWEVELHNVLGISQIGHRKRILTSLGERQPPDRQYPSLKKRITKPEVDENLKSPFKDVNLFKDYRNVKPLTSSEEDVNSKSSSHAFPPVDSSEDEEVFKSEHKQGMNIRDNSIHLRPPHQSTLTSPIKEWRHPPGMLIKGCCNYTAQYIGSTLVRELSGTSSTIEGISKLKKSAEVIAKIPTIMLSISYKGVKFIDAKSKKVICDHEIGNIFCACQDADSMNFFAYITRDNNTGKHYCHVFNVRNVDHAREIILTLGEAFEVAYQMALKEKASAGAMEFERQMSQSDAEADSISISSKASISTV